MAEQLEQIPYCHLCDCVIGWLHDATEHMPNRGGYAPHQPFLENDCEACWRSLAELANHANRLLR